MTDVAIFWAEFAAAAGVGAPHVAGAFAEATPELANELALRVSDGPKWATPGVWAEYEAGGEPLPEPGGYWVVLDGEGAPVCAPRTTRVELRRLGEVDEQFARDEGERDRSLVHWREAHIGCPTSIGSPSTTTPR